MSIQAVAGVQHGAFVCIINSGVPQNFDGRHRRCRIRRFLRPVPARLLKTTLPGSRAWNCKAIHGNKNPGHGCEKQSVQPRKVLCRITTGDRGPEHRTKTQDPHAHAERFRERDHGLPEAFLLVGKHQRQPAGDHDRLRHPVAISNAMRRLAFDLAILYEIVYQS